MPKSHKLFASSNLTRHIIVLVLALGVGLSVYVFYSWRKLEAADARVQFTKTAADHMVVVRANVLKAAIAVGYLGTVFEAAGDLDRTGFDRFAATVISNNPIIERLAWLPIVRPDGRAAIAAKAAAQGMTLFAITEKDWAGRIGEVSPRDVYYPVFYVAPDAGNEGTIGLDLGSDAHVRAALERAARTDGIVTVPNAAGFLDDDRGQPSYFVFVPVWMRASAPTDRQLRGFVVGQVRLLRAIFDGAPVPGPFTPQIAVFDLSTSLPEELIYPQRLDGITSNDVTAAGGSYWDFDIGVVTWRLAALPKGPLQPGFTWQSALVLVGGLAMTANLTGYLLLMRRRRRSVEQLVHMRTEEVETALAQLKVTEGRLNDYVTTGSDWYWDAGPNFRFTTVADRAREHGIDPKELLGLEQLIDGDAPAAIEKRLEVLARHEPFKDLRYDYAAGDRLLILSLSGVPKFDEKGEFRGYRGSARDITPQLRAEAEQRTARWAAEQANNAKSTFLANMSHEIRTPMNGVLGMVQILRQTELNEEQGRMCDIISHSGSTLLQILNDILDFSKLDAGKIELETVDCCLTDVVSDVVSLMRHTAEPKGMSLVFEHGPIAAPWVVGDPTRLRQILLNLISNGIKFSTRGGVMIRLETEEVADKRLKIVLSVTDHGIGMSPEEQRRLFSRFNQADPSSTRRFGGTGLGLAITRELIRLMGGGIAVQSKVGEGSTFTVRLTLPLAAHQGAVDPSASEAHRDGPQAQLNVLVAEDDAVNRLVIRMLLQAQGHQVMLVENGQEAIEAVRGVTYDLVLMDVMMPGTDGVTATRRIRELPAPSNGVPIIALTANAMKGDRDTYLEAGMNAYVSKPIDKKQLFSTVEQVLGVRVWSPDAEDETPPAAPNAAALGQLEDFISSL
jgi:signal transduction histidine kinase/CheY-like chemotaxis protein/sensor domain CHASE-containing protein